MSWREKIEDITREGDADQLVTKEQAAKLLAVSEWTVDRWRRQGVLRGVVLSERIIRYRMGDVRQLIRERSS